MKSWVLCSDEIQTSVALWDIGATGAHTKTANVPGKGFTSVARTAAGKYTVTFARGVPVGQFMGLQLDLQTAADAGPLNLKYTAGSYTSETQAAQATALYEAWSVGTAPAETEIPSGSKVLMTAVWQKTR